MGNSDKYKAVSRYDLKGNKHNFKIFLREIRATPVKAFGIALIFAALAVALLLVDASGSVKFSRAWQSWIIISLAGLAALFFFYQTLRGLFQCKANEK